MLHTLNYFFIAHSFSVFHNQWTGFLKKCLQITFDRDGTVSTICSCNVCKWLFVKMPCLKDTQNPIFVSCLSLSVLFYFSQVTQNPSISGFTQMLQKAVHLRPRPLIAGFASIMFNSLAIQQLENDFMSSFSFPPSYLKASNHFFKNIDFALQVIQNPFKSEYTQTAQKAALLLLNLLIEDFVLIMCNNPVIHLLDRCYSKCFFSKVVWLK